MYRTCIYCSAALGTNDAVEEFPVGRTLAFDGEKGRLWAVCRACARWNLAPIEERWEAIEAAERLFRDASLRVQAENVGLARLRDGTRLVRVGQALPGELAIWRYGRLATQRRIRWWVGTAGKIALNFSPLQVLHDYWAHAKGRERGHDLVHRLEPGQGSWKGDELSVRDLDRVRTRPGPDGGLELEVSLARHAGPVTLSGAAARRVLARALVPINRIGATRAQVDQAVTTLSTHGGADAYLREIARGEYCLAAPDLPSGPWLTLPWVGGDERTAGMLPNPLHLHHPLSLCAEMAVHAEQERRAMEGELAALEGMWRQAEEIAEIADRLPDGVSEETR